MPVTEIPPGYSGIQVFGYSGIRVFGFSGHLHRTQHFLFFPKPLVNSVCCWTTWSTSTQLATSTTMKHLLSLLLLLAVPADAGRHAGDAMTKGTGKTETNGMGKSKTKGGMGKTVTEGDTGDAGKTETKGLGKTETKGTGSGSGKTVIKGDAGDARKTATKGAKGGKTVSTGDAGDAAKTKTKGGKTESKTVSTGAGKNAGKNAGKTETGGTMSKHAATNAGKGKGVGAGAGNSSSSSACAAAVTAAPMDVDSNILPLARPTKRSRTAAPSNAAASSGAAASSSNATASASTPAATAAANAIHSEFQPDFETAMLSLSMARNAMNLALARLVAPELLSTGNDSAPDVFQFLLAMQNQRRDGVEVEATENPTPPAVDQDFFLTPRLPWA